MFPRSRRPLLHALAALALLLTTHAHAAVFTGFDAGPEGWTVTGDNASTWKATGGNPGGAFYVNDLVTGGGNLCLAPPRYLGDWRAATAADTLRADMFLNNTSGGAGTNPPWFFRISGPGGVARGIINPPPPPNNGWRTYRISLSAADWVLDRGTWSDLLAHVTSIHIMGEWINGAEDVRLDNVGLSFTPAAAFEACLTAPFNGTGLGEWSFGTTGGVSNPGSGGDAGGFCQVVDGAGTSYAFAPPAFLGDWSSLDGSGRLSIDLRVVSRAGNATGAAQFIRLSGPGGTAYVGLAPADLPPASRIWKTLSYPLQQASWTVTSGTWAGLLAYVTECRIQLEFFDSGETIGFDDFSRLSAACPDPGPSIAVHAGLTACGSSSFIGIQTVAHDPLTGRLGGLVRATTASGGGLWWVTGPQAGTLVQAYDQPGDLLYDPAGNCYVTEPASGNLNRRAVGGGTQIWVAGFHTGDDDPYGMCFAPAGFDGANVDPGDVLVTDIGSGGPDEVWAFSTAAAENERLVLPDPGEVNLYDIAPGDGVCWMVDELDSTAILALSPAGTLTPLTLSTPLALMTAIARDPGTRFLYVAQRGTKQVHRVDPLDGSVKLVASEFDSLGPGSLEITPQRELLVADFGASRVWSICLEPLVGVEEPWATDALALAISPNPLRSAASIRFALPRASRVELEVFDAAGRRARRLASGERRAGEHTVRWDGDDESGRPAPAGLYLVRLRAGALARTVRVVVIR